jgi:hypothetical protein
VLRVNIKVGEEPVIVQLSCGTKVRAYFVSQVASITVRHQLCVCDFVSGSYYDRSVPFCTPFYGRV